MMMRHSRIGKVLIAMQLRLVAGSRGKVVRIDIGEIFEDDFDDIAQLAR